jgi:hypothetical protein
MRAGHGWRKKGSPEGLPFFFGGCSALQIQFVAGTICAESQGPLGSTEGLQNKEEPTDHLTPWDVLSAANALGGHREEAYDKPT